MSGQTSSNDSWRALVHTLCVAVPAFLAVACAETPTAPPKATPPPSLSQADDSSGVSPLVVYSGEFSWSQGHASTPMGSSSGRVCFLTRISGDFEGGGEYVRTYISGGSWYLGGQSLQLGVSARARCLNVTGTTHLYEYSWSQGQYPRFMGGSRACFLTFVSGDFEGGGEKVEIFASNNAWYLGGNSLQQGVSARARCVRLGGGIVAYGYYRWDGWNGLSTILAPSYSYVCFLAGMTGKFEGAGEVVRTFASGGSWYAQASGIQWVNAKGGCVR